MRILIALPLLAVAACNVNNDKANDTVTLEYNQERIEDAASDAGNVVQDAASGVENVAQSAGRAIENEVGDIDVDLDINRTKADEKAGNTN